MIYPTPLVLASSSPRRHELIRHLGIPVVIDPSTVDETPIPGLSPGALAVALAKQKAQDVAMRHPAAAIIGADTLIEFQGAVLGKPRDPQDAERMLHSLAGASHIVHSGIAVVKGPDVFTDLISTAVRLRPCDSATIRAYVATGEPLDKAGAYAAQGAGAALIEEVRGSYLAVVGLPLVALLRLLHQVGVPVQVDMEMLERLDQGE